ncbi:NADH-quinone oxidoreductase subunit H [Methanospirillum sp. J.3.6.1-F.2.7.3]|uniref:NADH-quinone oxidoreductase subunit H n=1 Tax=Methanospirillum purgamenti TaxID=2834276 RepID=A0A8E7AY60_9EURY|nr:MULTISPECIES: NADH-quinone oxidoreductase subunit H [Methanospirillum]MDX8551460.1 NADH-quinone oxidoreductase subunit H [Methanospirillum hungatei]QVV89917.1 NADH-quinone oxidoreductase subunit H [Methanospirillum sp. J.3.6.1-F.2.7.3]
MNFIPVVYGVLNVLLVLGLAPLYITVVKKVKARVQGRRGPRIIQGYLNLAKLFKKEVIYSEYASFISRLAPYASISILLVAALMVPLVWVPDLEPVTGNIIVFLYLLVAGRLLLALLGLDVASSFGGMGSSREMSLSAIIEPVTVLVFAALAFVMGSLSIPEMFRHAALESPSWSPTILLLCISLFILIIVETGRIPVDNPETHLELTMVHEGMLLDTSGRNLALFELSHGVKQVLLMALLINILVPAGLMFEFSVPALIIGCFLFLLKGTVLSIGIGLFESSFAKMRFFQIPNLFMIAFFFSILTIFIEVMI